MDQEKLSQALEGILSPYPEVRQPSEDLLNNVSYYSVQDNYRLCELTAKAFRDPPSKQGALIYLKNLINDAWESLSQEDQLFLRYNVLQSLICQAEPLCRSMIEEIIKQMCSRCFPGNWPEIISQLHQALWSMDDSNKLSGLVCLRSLVKNYEYQLDKERQSLQILISNYFGRLKEIIAECLNDQSEESLTNQNSIILLEALKTYWIATHIDMDPCLIEVNLFQQWLEIILHVLKRPIDKLQQPLNQNESETDRSAHPWWQIKKIAAQVAHRFLMRFGSVQEKTEDKRKASELFITQYALQYFYEVWKQILSSNQYFVCTKTMNFLIKFLTLSCKNESLFGYFCNELPRFYEEILFNLIKLKAEDEKRFEEDPIEFIRFDENDYAAFENTKMSCLEMLQVICNKKNENGQYEQLQTFLKVCGKHLESGSNDFVLQEAIILAISSVEIAISNDKDILSKIEEGFINKYVLPLFSLQGYQMLKYRACATYITFAPVIEPRNKQKQLLAIQYIHKCLQEQSMPLKFIASKAVASILAWQEAIDYFQNHLTEIYSVFIFLIREIDNEDLVTSLETVIQKYHKFIEPHALELTYQISSAFLRMSGKDANLDDGEAAFAAGNCVSTLNLIVESLANNQELLTKLVSILYPVIQSSLTPEGSEHSEEGLTLLSSVLYYLDYIPEEFWNLITQICNACVGNEKYAGWANELVPIIVPVIQNFIQKGKEQFALRVNEQGESCVIQIITLCQKIFNSSEKSNQVEISFCCKIFIALLENLVGAIDFQIQDIMTIVIYKYQQVETYNLKQVLMRVISMCFWYNQNIALQVCQKLNSTDAIITTLLQQAHQNEGLDRKRLLFGLASLLKVDFSQAPQEVTSKFLNILQSSLQLLKEIVIEQEKNSVDEPKIQIPLDQVFSTNHKLKNVMIEIDPAKVQDQDMEAIYKSIKQAGESELNEMDYANEDSSYIDQDDDMYDSPLDNINDQEFFKQILQNLMNQQNIVYQNLLMECTMEEKQTLMTLLAS